MAESAAGVAKGCGPDWHAEQVSTSRPRLWTWGQRLEVVGYTLGAFAGVVLAIDSVLERDWVRLLIMVVVVVVATRGLLRALRHGSPSGRAAEDRRRRDVEGAKREMTPTRILALAEQHQLDVRTSAGKVALIKVLREADSRLGLVDAKGLVDGLRL